MQRFGGHGVYVEPNDASYTEAGVECNQKSSYGQNSSGKRRALMSSEIAAGCSPSADRTAATAALPG